MATSKQKKLDKNRAKYGESDSLFRYEWKNSWGDIACIPANSLSESWSRLLDLLEYNHHFYWLKVLKTLKKKKLLSKYVRVTRLKLEKPTVFSLYRPW